METGEVSRPKVVLPPPLVAGVPLASGLFLQWAFPLRLPFRCFNVGLGALCLLSAVALWFAARAAFRRAGTSMRPASRSRSLIVDGPFRFNKNPLYVGVVLLYAGLSLVASAGWPLIFLPIIVISLPAGTHEYKFIVNGTWFSDPKCPDWIPDGCGSLNSVLHV